MKERVLQMPSQPHAVGPERFAECRSMGHEWNHLPAIGSDDPQSTWSVPFGGSYGMIGLPSTCRNCKTRRMRWVTRSGESLMRYLHPEGYETHGEERKSATEWRRTFVATIFDEFETAHRVTREAS